MRILCDRWLEIKEEKDLDFFFTWSLIKRDEKDFRKSVSIVEYITHARERIFFDLKRRDARTM